MIQEFETLAGFEVTPEEYAKIELMYYEFDGDKRAFVKWFKKENKMMDVLRDLIQIRDTEAKKAASELLASRTAADALAAECRSLREKLDREQEWKPFEDDHNVKQADYEHLKNDVSTSMLLESEAIDMIADEFGFEKSKVKIIREIAKEEINRYGQCRKAGSYWREPRFNAWDWNYIRFDVSGVAYEMYNGQLRFFWR